MPSPDRQKWIVAGAMGMLGYVVWGVGFYALPVFYVPLKTEFGWTRVELTSIGVFTILLYSLSGPAIGTLIDTRGIRKVVIGGLTLFGLSLAFFAVSAKTLRAFYLVGAVFGVACACLSLLPSQVLVVQWFEQKRATAMGFVLTLMGLGGAVNASLAGSLIGRVGWRHTALIFDLLVWIFALPLGLSLIKERIPAEPCKPEQGSVGTGGVTLSQAARSPQFYLLCSAVFLNMAVGNAVLANIVLHIFELGHGLRFATSVMSLLVLANLIARPVIGNISDWTSIRFGALLSFGCLGLSVFVLLLAKSKVLLLLVGLLAGLGYGGSIVMVGVVTAAIFGSRALGRILGFVVLSLGAGSACGTLLVGRIFDRTGSYQLGFLMLLVFAMSSVVAISRVRPQPLRTLKPLPEAQLSRVALAPRRNR